MIRAAAAGLVVAALVLLLYPRADLLERDAPRTGRPGESAPAPASYAAAVEAAAPAVVNVQALRYVRERRSPLLEDPVFRRFFERLPDPEDGGRSSLGSGVIVGEEGYVLSSRHVIESAHQLMVSLPDGRMVDATVIGSDLATDIAVLRLDSAPYPRVALGDPGEVRVGDVVLAIGNPYGVGQTVTQGIVSATGRNLAGTERIENFIQTDAAVNPGNSGGALINARGELIGINTVIVSQSGGASGISFAVPADTAMEVMRELINRGVVVRGWLGIQVADVVSGTPDGGVMVKKVLEGGPGHAAGLRPGDVITHIVGEPIADNHEAVELIADFDPGTRIQLTVVRDGRPLTLHATVAERPRLMAPER